MSVAFPFDLPLSSHLQVLPKCVISKAIISATFRSSSSGISEWGCMSYVHLNIQSVVILCGVSPPWLSIYERQMSLDIRPVLKIMQIIWKTGRVHDRMWVCHNEMRLWFMSCGMFFFDLIFSLFLCWDHFKGTSWGNASSTSLILPVCYMICVYVGEKSYIVYTAKQKVISQHIQPPTVTCFMQSTSIC